MIESPEPARQKPEKMPSRDPMGFLMLLILLIIFGGAILFLVHWVSGLIEKAG